MGHAHSDVPLRASERQSSPSFQHQTGSWDSGKIPAMNIDEIIQQLKQERSRLDAAIAALEGGNGPRNSVAGRRGRPPGSTNKPLPNGRKRRTMSPAARKRIAEATKQRWAAAKKSGKKKL